MAFRRLAHIKRATLNQLHSGRDQLILDVKQTPIEIKNKLFLLQGGCGPQNILLDCFYIKVHSAY